MSFSVEDVSVKVLLAIAESWPVSWIANWRNRAATAHLASLFYNTQLKLRDVLPGPPYLGFGPWTDEEQRVIRACDLPRENLAMPKYWHLVLPRSLRQVQRPTRPEDSLSSTAASPVRPSPKSDALRDHC